MDVGQLQDTTTGPVLVPGDDGFDDARRLWNVRFDRSPDVVLRCADADDVVAGIRWAGTRDVLVHVKGGGHSYAGHTVGDGGLLLDLSPMSGIKVRAEERRVTVGGGATWSQLDAATQHHGLAVPGPTVSSVGVAGSTLSGGTGWLSRRFGHALDNLRSVQLVTADGRLVTASPDVEPELFWGLRGAGQNLGVVTSMELELHEVGPLVLAGQIVHRFDDAERMLAAYARVMQDAPDEFQCFAFTFRAPPVEPFPVEVHGEPLLDFVVFHTDPTATDVVTPLRELGDPVLDVVGPMEYADVQRTFDANLPGGQRYFSVAHDLASLTDDAVADFARFVRSSRGAFTASYLEPHGGAAGRVDPAGTAMGRGDAVCGFHVIAGWQDAAEDDEVMGWARGFEEAMAVHATGGAYVALLNEGEDDRIPSSFSDAERVRSLKQAWDPDNRLRGNHNVAPGD